MARPRRFFASRVRVIAPRQLRLVTLAIPRVDLPIQIYFDNVHGDHFFFLWKLLIAATIRIT